MRVSAGCHGCRDGSCPEPVIAGRARHGPRGHEPSPRTRGALVFSLLALTVLSRADRLAVVVALDDYPWITEPARRLKGAATDASLMGRTLGLYGFRTTTLLRRDATRERIVGAMERVVAAAKRGDEAVLYFSGRGSVAPDGEPVLVPADGAAKASAADVRMARLESWAARLGAKGARSTIVLDASFVDPGRSDYGRQYNPTPRCVPRPGSVRPQLYRGPGLLLSACPAQGAAYEWLVNSAEGRWAGAFTDTLTNALVASLNRGGNPSALDAMREAQDYFKDKVRAGYMPGLSPQPAMAAMMAEAARYGAPIFGGLDPKALPPDSRLALAAAERARLAREGRLRVAFEAVDPKLRPGAERDLVAYLKRVPKAAYAAPGEPPDVILRVEPGPKGLAATLVGDDLDKTMAYRFEGKDLRRALDAGLGDVLRLRALVARMYRLTDGAAPTWKAAVRVELDRASVARGEGFRLAVETPAPALLFVLDRDDADGVLQLAFPQPGAPYSQLVSKAARLEASAAADSSDGRMMLRAVLVPAAKAGAAPIKMDDRAFRARLLAQLQKVVEGMESGKIPWTARTLDLRIR